LQFNGSMWGKWLNQRWVVESRYSQSNAGGGEC
jgi:hypothetical protein